MQRPGRQLNRHGLLQVPSVGQQTIQAPFENPRFAPEGFSFASMSSLRVTQDGRVFTWTEPLVAHRLRAYVQEQGRKRVRVRDIEQGSGAVIGPVT